MANLINDGDIRVNVIAINFFDELDKEFDIDNDNNNRTEESENQKLTKESLKNLMALSSNVKVFTSKMANAIYKQFRKKRVKPYIKYRGPLYFSDNLYIDVNVFSKTVKTEIPSLKKFSKASEYSNNKKNLLIFEISIIQILKD